MVAVPTNLVGTVVLTIIEGTNVPTVIAETTNVLAGIPTTFPGTVVSTNAAGITVHILIP